MQNSKFYEYSDVKNPKYLVIFLHGYGSNGENLISLAHQFKDVLPQAHFISPNAIEPWEGGFPDSYQWFSLYRGFDRKALEEIAHNIKNSNKILTDFINRQLQRFNLKSENLFIVGFSQGGMMALYQGLAMDEKVAGVICFSGRIILPESVGDQTRSKPQICLIHGEQDSVLPIEYFIESKKVLTQENIAHEAHQLANLDHAIDLRSIQLAQAFIKKQITR